MPWRGTSRWLSSDVGPGTPGRRFPCAAPPLPFSSRQSSSVLDDRELGEHACEGMLSDVEGLGGFAALRDKPRSKDPKYPV